MLSQLVASHSSITFGLFGIIKEIGVDDEGLADFYDQYFPHPLYLDSSQQFYQAALGGRKITTLRTWNPLRLYRGFQAMKARIARKKLEGNMVGEGLVQGGVIIFDRHGEPRAVYQELTGQELPVDDILAALTALQAEADGATAPDEK